MKLPYRFKIVLLAVVAACVFASAASAQWVDPGGTWPPATVLLVVPTEVPALTLPPDSTADTQRLEDPAPPPTVAADSQPAAAVPTVLDDRPPVPENPVPPGTIRPPVPDNPTAQTRPPMPDNPVPPTTLRPPVPDNPIPADTDRPGRPCNPYRGCGPPPAAGL